MGQTRAQSKGSFRIAIGILEGGSRPGTDSSGPGGCQLCRALAAQFDHLCCANRGSATGHSRRPHPARRYSAPCQHTTALQMVDELADVLGIGMLAVISFETIEWNDVEHAIFAVQQTRDGIEFIVAVVDALEQPPLMLDRIVGVASVSLAKSDQFSRRNFGARAVWPWSCAAPARAWRVVAAGLRIRAGRPRWGTQDSFGRYCLRHRAGQWLRACCRGYARVHPCP